MSFIMLNLPKELLNLLASFCPFKGYTTKICLALTCKELFSKISPFKIAYKEFLFSRIINTFCVDLLNQISYDKEKALITILRDSPMYIHYFWYENIPKPLLMNCFTKNPEGTIALITKITKQSLVGSRVSLDMCYILAHYNYHSIIKRLGQKGYDFRTPLGGHGKERSIHQY